MKTLFLFLATSFICAVTWGSDEANCASGKISYKYGKENNSVDAEICKNEYSQFYAKKCADGCDFAKAIKENNGAEVEDAIVGSPGGQICKQLGFQSFIAEIEFKGSKTQNVDLCFNKDRSAFVSTGFLRDLMGDEQ